MDDLQPQDLSTAAVPTVIDLTRKGGECASDVAALNSLVRSPEWCPNSAARDPQLAFSESAGSSDVKLQSGEQIRSDDALSHTTVTLSYVSRSHVCTPHDALSQHSPLSALPAISKLPPCSARNSDVLRELNQHYSERVDGPVDIGVPTEHFQSSSQAQLGSEDNVPAKESHEVKSRIISRDLDEPLREENGLSLKNGEVDGWESPGVCAQTLIPDAEDDEETEGCEVVFVVSKKPDPAATPHGIGAGDLCRLREYVSPLEDPISPSVTSQDGVEDGFDLPQASSSPSGDNCYHDAMDRLVWDGSSTDSANQLRPGLTAGLGSESKDGDEQPIQKQNTVSEPSIGATEGACLSDELQSKPANAHVNGNATALQKTVERKRLPPRSSRGTRLGAIVMNINSSSYKVSGCIRTNKKRSRSLRKCDAKITSSESNGNLPRRRRSKGGKASLLEDTVKQTVIPVKEGSDDNRNTDSHKDSTSSSPINHSVKPQNSTPPKSPRPSVHADSKKRPRRRRSASDPAVEIYVARVSPRAQSSKSPKKSKGKASARGASVKRAARSPRSRRKKRKGRKQSQCAAMFSPKEPEIKLRYVTYKEEKRDPRADSFSPFVHVERRQASPSLCTVVNYREEVKTDLKKGQGPPGGFVPGAVPGTSCLQLGRASAHGQRRRSLVCCLCGQSANAIDLGDLHGPYYPEGYRAAAKRPAGTPGLKGEEDDSDSDSSSSTIKERGGKRVVQQPSRRLRPGAKPWPADDPCSPAAKRARPDAGAAVAQDWYSAPVLPLEPCEYWLHEDCGVWSAGVYLVKGKVYGLEEAVRAAQDMVMVRPGTAACFHNLRRDE